LRIDANCAWTAETGIAQLKAMEEFRLAGVEQPVPGEDIDGMAAITATGLVPVVADESLCSLADAETLIARRACDVFNLRVSKCGGLYNTGRIHAAAREAGLKCQLGAQVGETGILSAAGRHIATRCADILWREGSYGKLLLEQDIVEPDITVGPEGRAGALQTPGLGVRPVADLVERYVTERTRLDF
jgi:muconate cycloisomerase